MSAISPDGTSAIARVTLAIAIMATTACASAPSGDAVDEASSSSAFSLSVRATRTLSLNYGNSCAVVGDHAVACWGRDSSGQLGDGTVATTATPLPRIVASISSAISVAAGSDHACALLPSGAVTCWGDDFFGELGDGQRTISSLPDSVTGPLGSGGVTALAAGVAFTCALGARETTWCWGTDASGQLGDNRQTALSSTPVVVPGASGAVAIAAGEDHACALLSSGAVRCWGSNDTGQLGTGSLADEGGPADVVGVSDAIAVAAGVVHACALRGDGSVVCWGYGGDGALGDGTDTSSPVPVAVSGISDATDIAAGGFATCALHRGGGVSCWGRNDSGQLGDGTTIDSSTPVTVAGLCDVREVAVGDGHACARVASGAVYCWGANEFGQLGDRTTTPSPFPVRVAIARSERLP